jgi:hypothetical protein
MLSRAVTDLCPTLSSPRLPQLLRVIGRRQKLLIIWTNYQMTVKTVI